MYGAIIINRSDLSNMSVGDLMSSNRFLGDRFKAIKILTGYNFDNTHLYFSNSYGDLYAIVFHKIDCPVGSPNHGKYSKLFNDILLSKHVISTHIWTQGGSTSIYNDVFLIESFGKNVPAKTMTSIKNATDGYSKDKTLPCSDCGIKIHHKTKEIGGHYFAGIYCVTCWLGTSGKHKARGGWKAIEAKETYN